MGKKRPKFNFSGLLDQIGIGSLDYFIKLFFNIIEDFWRFQRLLRPLLFFHYQYFRVIANYSPLSRISFPVTNASDSPVFLDSPRPQVIL
jgi:hypothetical protein